MQLYNNYILESAENEVYTGQEKIEENELLDTILSSGVIQHTRNFLISKGKCKYIFIPLETFMSLCNFWCTESSIKNICLYKMMFTWYWWIISNNLQFINKINGCWGCNLIQCKCSKGKYYGPKKLKFIFPSRYSYIRKNIFLYLENITLNAYQKEPFFGHFSWILKSNYFDLYYLY